MSPHISLWLQVTQLVSFSFAPHQPLTIRPSLRSWDMLMTALGGERETVGDAIFGALSNRLTAIQAWQISTWSAKKAGAKPMCFAPPGANTCPCGGWRYLYHPLNHIYNLQSFHLYLIWYDGAFMAPNCIKGVSLLILKKRVQLDPRRNTNMGPPFVFLGETATRVFFLLQRLPPASTGTTPERAHERPAASTKTRAGSLQGSS